MCTYSKEIIFCLGIIGYVLLVLWLLLNFSECIDEDPDCRIDWKELKNGKRRKHKGVLGSGSCESSGDSEGEGSEEEEKEG